MAFRQFSQTPQTIPANTGWRLSFIDFPFSFFTAFSSGVESGIFSERLACQEPISLI
jgi:hypothetical protein